MEKTKEKMTHEEFADKCKKWGWLCRFLPHNYVSADNEVCSGTAICLRCGDITSAEAAGLPFDEHTLDNTIR